MRIVDFSFYNRKNKKMAADNSPLQNYYKPVLFMIYMKNKNLNKIKKIIVVTLKKYGIKKAGIFGSYVKGEQKKGSDIDYLKKRILESEVRII